jgi:undecaprenyl-diphosphatase
MILTAIQAAIMGFVQGLTEFLPVSSSAHLVFASHFLKLHLMESDTVSFDVLLHLGTLLAVLIYFRKDVKMLILGGLQLAMSPAKAWKENAFSRLFAMLIIGTVPAGIFGILFKDFFSSVFKNIPLTAALLLLTATMLFWISSRPTGEKQIKNITVWDAVLVGLFQAFAILPGVSRSGSTITGGLIRGMDRETAPRFSFLLSMPVILGGGLIDLKKLISQGTDLPTTSLIIGFFTAAISGYIAIVFLMDIVKRGKLHYFGIYCVIIAISIIIYWQTMVPQLNFTTLSATAVDEKNPSLYNDMAKEITAVNIGRIIKFKFSANSGMYRVVDARVLVPTGMVGKKNNRIHYDVIECIPAGENSFVSEGYNVVPLGSTTIDSGGDTREITIILRNSIGVEQETKVLLRVVKKNRVAQIWGSGKVYRQ